MAVSNTPMISKQNRFHGHRSLNYVYGKGQAVRGEFISLRYADNKRDDYRLAVVVSRKVSKLAVVRNRIRRRIYEIVREHRRDSKANWRKDLVISVFDERIAAMPAEELRSSVLKLLAKAKL